MAKNQLDCISNVLVFCNFQSQILHTILFVLIDSKAFLMAIHVDVEVFFLMQQ